MFKQALVNKRTILSCESKYDQAESFPGILEPNTTPAEIQERRANK